jgi:hypothetical protein
MCFVLRRWIHWWPAAFFGGLLYAACGYTAWENVYIFLIFVPLPPLIFLFLHEILVRQQWPRARTGILFGVVCSIQFFVSTEVLGMTIVMGAIAVALLIVIHRHTLVERWRYAVTAFAFSVGVCSLVLLYPLWFTFAGPQHLNGPPTPGAYWAQIFPADALSLVLHGTFPDPMHPSLASGGMLYLGPPLIVVLLGFVVFFRRRKEIVFAGVMALIAYVLSLGPRLWVNGHETSIPLPFVVFEHLPAVEGFWPGRFALFTVMFVAGMFAIGIEELWNRLSRSRQLRLSRGWSVVGRIVIVGVVVGAVAVPLIPRSTPGKSPTRIPTFFTSTALNSVPPGSAVLAYPYPDATLTAPLSGFSASVMLYEAAAGMRFKLIGGYGWFPSPTGHNGTSSPALLEPQSVETLFDVTLDRVETPTEHSILSNRNLTNDLRVFLKRFDVQTVMVTQPRSILSQENLVGRLGDPSPVIARITAAIGRPVYTGGVTVWFHVRQRLAAVAS